MQILKIVSVFVPLMCILPFLSAQDHESHYKIIDVTDYSFRIELNDTTDIIQGKTKLTFTLLQKTDTIFIDLANLKPSGKGMQVIEILSGDKPVFFNHIGDKIRIPAFGIDQNESGNYSISYHGIPEDGLIISKNKYGDRTFFGDNWPNRAHQWLPCIDHPSDKAKLEFTIVAPSHYQTIANGYCSVQSVYNGVTTSTWKTNVPIPTKIMVIGVAKFAKQDLATISEVPVSTWVYPQNKFEGFNDYSVAVKPLVYYCNLIAAFPFSKLANVQSTTLYGGMENASCIFYAENSVTGQAKAERLMAHEIAHQWFGDAVSEKDWYHIWLSEGFATYLTDMYIEENYGRAAFLNHLNLERKEVFEFEMYHPSPIIDTSLSISADLLSPNTYQKAGWVLHMLRKEMGDSLFIRCLRSFYKEFEYKNALTIDFQNVVERTTGRDFDQFFDQWLYKTGHPILKITWYYQSHYLIINIKQIQKNTLFQFPLELKIINKNSVSSVLRLDISDVEQEFSLSYPENPKMIIPDPGNWLLYESEIAEINPNKM